MSKYPTEITPELLANNAHLPDAELEQDIRDTEAEIATMTREAEGYRLIAQGSGPDAKMAYFKARAREDGIAERREFVAFLRLLLAARAQAVKA